MMKLQNAPSDSPHATVPTYAPKSIHQQLQRPHRDIATEVHVASTTEMHCQTRHSPHARGPRARHAAGQVAFARASCHPPITTQRRKTSKLSQRAGAYNCAAHAKTTMRRESQAKDNKPSQAKQEFGALLIIACAVPHVRHKWYAAASHPRAGKRVARRGRQSLKCSSTRAPASGARGA